MVWGSNYSVKGIITSKSKITWLWVGVQYGNGYTHALETSVNPMATSYDISKISRNLNFSSLAIGDYTFQIDAIINGEYYEIIRKPFSVVKQTSEKVNKCSKGHSWNSGQITKRATYLSTGTRIRTCTVCGKKETISIGKLCGTNLKGVKNKKGKKVSVSWKKNSKVTGYQIQYATNSAFKGAKSKTVKGAKKTTCTLSKLKKSKTYYVRVRTYTKKNYSGWSEVKKVIIRK